MSYREGLSNKYARISLANLRFFQVLLSELDVHIFIFRYIIQFIFEVPKYTIINRLRLPTIFRVLLVKLNVR